MLDKEAQEFACHEHVYLRQFIQAADQKAGFTLTASSALLAFLVNNFASDKSLLSGSACRLVLGIISIALLGTAGLFAAIAVRPRQSGITTGLVGWIGILDRKNGNDYLTAIRDANPTTEIVAHCHSLAKILRTKYRLLEVAIDSFIAGGAATVLLLALAVVSRSR